MDSVCVTAVARYQLMDSVCALRCGNWHQLMDSVCVTGVVHGTSWELEKVRGNGVMAMLTLAIISVVAALQVFGKDRLIFWRESESG